jgi:hypothetical protein
MNFRIYVLWFSILFRIIYIYKNISMIGIYKFGKKKINFGQIRGHLQAYFHFRH